MTIAQDSVTMMSDHLNRIDVYLKASDLPQGTEGNRLPTSRSCIDGACQGRLARPAHLLSPSWTRQFASLAKP